MELVFAGLLGLVHGFVGLAHQVIGIGHVLRIEPGHANADRNLQHVRPQGDRLCRCPQQALQQRRGIDWTVQVYQYRHKFVAAKARQRIAFAQRVVQVLCYCL